jgi:predicted nucleic-acid-binding Zn-ribbon protein
MQAPIEGLHRNFFNQSLARVSMRTCMDCGYIELYREEMLKQDD